MDEYKILIKNANIVDGSGKPAYKGSLGVIGDKVVATGEVKGDAETVIDAKGLTAVPGFIDSHSHGDMNILFFPKCENYLLQGVTTFVGGQCGMSLAPIRDKLTLPGIASEHIQEIEPHKYYPKRTVFPREEVNEVMKKHFGWTVDWSTMAEWFKVVEEKQFSANMAPLIGHCTVRSTVMEDDYQRVATDAEVTEMGELVRQSMEDGCVGMSVGLDYEPDTFASKEEMVAHLNVVKEYDGVFCPHSRRTGRRRGVSAGHRQHDKIDGIMEVLELCRASGVKMNIAHLFTGWYVNPGDYPHMLEVANRKATLKVVDKARDEGLDISFDVLPNVIPSAYSGWSYLCSTFVPWLREKGSREEFAKWLKIQDYRDEIKDAIKNGKWFIRVAFNPNTNPRWAEKINIVEHKDKAVVDKTLAKVAEEREADAFETWFDLIVEDPDAKSANAFVYPGGKPDPDAPYHSIFFEHPESALGIDTGVTDYKWVSKVPPWRSPMTNSYSAFPGFWEKFVNKEKVFTLEQAVHKTSTQAAIRHKLKGRGTINEGSYADIVLMDLPKVKVTAKPLEPRNKPKGIKYVIVNGAVVVDKAKHTGATPGRVLRRE